MKESPALLQGHQEKTPVPVLGSDGHSEPIQKDQCGKVFIWDENLFHLAPFSEDSF